MTNGDTMHEVHLQHAQWCWNAAVARPTDLLSPPMKPGLRRFYGENVPVKESVQNDRCVGMSVCHASATCGHPSSSVRIPGTYHPTRNDILLLMIYFVYIHNLLRFPYKLLNYTFRPVMHVWRSFVSFFTKLTMTHSCCAWSSWNATRHRLI